MASTLAAIKAASHAKDAREKRDTDFHKTALVLTREYLRANGYSKSCDALAKEVGSGLEKLELADNVDLGSVIREFDSYYQLKLGRPPKLLRRRDNENEPPKPPGVYERRKRGAARAAAEKAERIERPREAGESVALGVLKSRLGVSAGEGAANVPQKPMWLDNDGVTGSKIEPADRNAIVNDNPNERILKPPPAFSGDSELQALANVIQREIYAPTAVEGDGWGEVVGLESAKSLLREAVVMPARYPQLFRGLTASWGGVLLFGPPGTGKTLLARAVATQTKTTFFNISASSIVSKYRGDSEKLVRVLFDLARWHAPSTVFFDEIDSIMAQRGGQGGTGNEHEGSRRMKTEVLIQMDGLSNKNSSDMVLVLAASNLPWELDVALLRRLEKRVLVPLPDQEARRQMVSSFLAGRIGDDCQIDDYAQQTEGYSGSDLRLVCKEAAMRPVRRLVQQLEAMESSRGGEAVPDSEVQKLMGENRVTHDDVSLALKGTKPSAKLFADKYRTWEANFGSS